MKLTFKTALITGLLATAGFAATAQGFGHGGDGHRDPAKMEQMMAKRMDGLKAALKLTPAQEGSWSTFAGTMKPTGAMAAMMPDHDAMAKLTTPERIDKMKAMRATHTAEMDKRADATKTFYATLTPEQQKTFDAQAMKRGGRHGMRGRHHGDRKAAPAAPAN